MLGLTSRAAGRRAHVLHAHGVVALTIALGLFAFSWLSRVSDSD